ncbi:MAG TPA: AbrB/MazE/SpoVT family DNA-binding domain-containing protein [Candidatus Peribacteraceae bacterium]|nr:AbrB/MazE/SpoVT family DNA-binding domain-containing protein [Candidatus Peribacteraceae bacterium]
MTQKVIKSTERGQITLPKKWRGRFPTDNYFIEMHDDKLIIRPLHIKDIQEEILFDADRDNDGKGVSADEIIRALKKIKKHG